MLRKKSARLPISRNIELKSNEIYFDKDNKKVDNDDKNTEMNNSTEIEMSESKGIQNIWKTIDKQINDKNSKYYTGYSTNKFNKRHKTIRVFISSTFTDFFSEREILVKQVFPELREWCLDRNLDLIECDLRWGVRKDSPSDQTILTCLNELDRCYEENDGQPFLVGLLGEKYGWVPEYETLSNLIKEKYNWIPRCSITSMEFIHGALRSKNKNACFFLRSKESLNGIPLDFNEKFYESDEFSKLQLKTLKEKLRKYHQNQVFDYTCKYEGLDETTGRKKVKLGELNEFGRQVLEFLTNAIEKAYPDNKPMNRNTVNENRFESYDELLEDEQDFQDAFIKEKNDFIVPKKKILEPLLDYILNESISPLFKQYGGQMLNDNEDIKNYPLILFGEEGSGKSSLLAYIANYLIKNEHDVFYHFFDASFDSGTTRMQAARFEKHYSKVLSKYERLIQLKYNSYESDKVFENICQEVYKNLSKKSIIIIDGFDKSDLNEKLIPKNLPYNIKLILSCNSTSKDVADSIVGSHKWIEITLDNFDKEESKIFIEKYMDKYNKVLDDGQMNLMLNKISSKISPLWLSFACSELRIFGEFTTINQKIVQLSGDLDGLLCDIIKRIITDYRDGLVKEVLCFLEISNHGIPENEGVLLFEELNIDRLTWSQILRSFSSLIKFSSFYGSKLVFIAHKRIRMMIHELFLKDQKEKILDYRLKLIDFYKNKSQYYFYACNQICFQYETLKYDKIHRISFIEFLKSKLAITHLNDSRRAFFYNDLRCKFPTQKTEEHCVYICFNCASKFGNFSANKMNKNSCFVCGSLVFLNSKKFAFTCLRHDQNVYGLKCYICKFPIQKNNKIEALNPIKTALCTFCTDFSCCMFDT